MVTVICQHSKLEFEAETRRTKQHPDIANLKAKANKDGNYREVNTALDEATEQGGYTTIDEYMTLVRQIIDGKMQKRTERINRQAAAEKEHEAEVERIREERRQQNDLLKANGYRWQKEVVTDEDAHPMDYRESGVYWHLIAPDGLEISKTHALEAIERGLETVRAEIAVEKAEAERQAAEAKAEKERQEAEDLSIIDAFDKKVAEIKNTCERVERFEYEYSDREVIAETYSGRNFRAYRPRDEILKFVIDDIDHYITIIGTGYDDDGYYTYYRATKGTGKKWIALTNPEDYDDADDAPHIQVEVGYNPTFRPVVLKDTIGDNIDNAKRGWKPVTRAELVKVFPRRPSTGKWDHYTSPTETDEGVSILVDAEWNETWREESLHQGHSTMSISYATVEGIELMKISNGFVYEPYYIRDPKQDSISAVREFFAISS